ncbi:MAG: hypothetical protein ABEK59_03515 [Halobacteria archaeon]
MVRVERTYLVNSTEEDLWSLVTDPDVKVDLLSPVQDYEPTKNGYRWLIEAPVIGETPLKTDTVTKEPNSVVKYRGKKFMIKVTTIHRILDNPDPDDIDAVGDVDDPDEGIGIYNRFNVKTRIPGGEKGFKDAFERKEKEKKEEVLEFIESFEADS